MELQRFVDRGQHAVGGVSRAGDVSVGKDGEELRRGSTKDARRVDVADRAGERGGHHLQRLFRRARAVGLDQEDSKVPLITMCPRQFVLEDRAHKTVVEEARCPIDDVQRLGLWVVGAHPARRAKDSAVG